MDLSELTKRVMANPAPTDLLALQSALLAVEETSPSEEIRDLSSSTLEVLGDFYCYLVELAAKLDAHEYAELASKLDIAGVGGVVLDNVLDAGDKLMQHVLIGGLSESLMVLASRQYVKAFNRERDAMHEMTAWKMRAHWWRFSTKQRPDLAASQRGALITSLLQPVFNPEVAGEIKPVLLGRLFQVLLLGYISLILSCSD